MERIYENMERTYENISLMNQIRKDPLLGSYGCQNYTPENAYTFYKNLNYTKQLPTKMVLDYESNYAVCLDYIPKVVIMYQKGLNTIEDSMNFIGLYLCFINNIAFGLSIFNNDSRIDDNKKTSLQTQHEELSHLHKSVEIIFADIENFKLTGEKIHEKGKDLMNIFIVCNNMYDRFITYFDDDYYQEVDNPMNYFLVVSFFDIIYLMKNKNVNRLPFKYFNFCPVNTAKVDLAVSKDFIKNTLILYDIKIKETNSIYMSWNYFEEMKRNLCCYHHINKLMKGLGYDHIIKRRENIIKTYNNECDRILNFYIDHIIAICNTSLVKNVRHRKYILDSMHNIRETFSKAQNQSICFIRYVVPSIAEKVLLYSTDNSNFGFDCIISQKTHKSYLPFILYAEPS